MKEESAVIPLETLKARYDEVVFMLKSSLQAYHVLANIINGYRHTTATWNTCNEESCKAARIACGRLEIDVR